MKQIQETALALAMLSLLLVSMAVAGFVVHRATSHPPIYTPQPELKNRGVTEAVLTAQTLDGLRQVCLHLALNQDKNRAFTEAQWRGLESLMNKLFVAALVFGAGFSVPLFFVYAKAKHIRAQLSGDGKHAL